MLKQWEIAGGEIVKSKVYSHHRDRDSEIKSI